MTRYAAKVDGNQASIVSEGRAGGYTVTLTHRLGGGFPDILVTRAGSLIALLVEIKTPDAFKSKGQGLTPKEIEFRETYTGPYMIAKDWESIEDYFVKLQDSVK